MSANEVVKRLEEIVAKAIANELDIKVTGVDIERRNDDDGNQIVQVIIKLTVSQKKWKRGSMFDLVTTTARTLRANGEMGIPYVLAKMSEEARVRAS